MLTGDEILAVVDHLNGDWADKALEKTPHKRTIPDMDFFSESGTWRGGRIEIQRALWGMGICRGSEMQGECDPRPKI